MRGVILRETDILNRALKGEFEKKPLDTIRILAKYYLGQNKNIDDVIVQINEYMEKFYSGFKPSKWKDRIENIVKTTHKTNNFNLIDIDKIDIYESEWENIIALNDRQLEKLAFTLLVYQKINEIKSPDSNGWINNNLTDIFTEASLTGGKDYYEKKLLFNELYNLQYIKQKNTVDATSLQVNFRELDKEEKVKFVVDNLSYAITYYYEHRDGVFYTCCEECNKRIIKKNNKTKYCNKCAKEANKLKTLNKYHRKC